MIRGKKKLGYKVEVAGECNQVLTAGFIDMIIRSKGRVRSVGPKRSHERGISQAMFIFLGKELQRIHPWY